MNDLITQAKQNMQKILDVLSGDLNTIRTGRAMPSLVEGITISAYSGSARMRVMELGTVSVSDTQTLVITPFDPSIITEIQKGIEAANTGLNPVVDGHLIRISIPPLSLERREQLIHLMRQKLENGKVMIRGARHESMGEIKKLDADSEITEDDKTRLEKDIQKVTDEAISQIDMMGKKKEEELLQI